MTTQTPPAGWHPDPADPTSSLRWWDGAAWTQHTQGVMSAPSAPAYDMTPAAAEPSHYGSGPAQQFGYAAQASPQPGYGFAPGQPTYGYPQVQQPALSFAKRNAASLTAIGVVALYVVIAMYTRVVMFGIFPVLLSARAFRAKEQLAPVAAIAAAIAVVIAFVVLNHA